MCIWNNLLLEILLSQSDKKEEESEHQSRRGMPDRKVAAIPREVNVTCYLSTTRTKINIADCSCEGVLNRVDSRCLL